MTLPAESRSPGELLPFGRRFRIVLVLGFLTALGPLTIDMYLPSLPTISTDLQASAAAVTLGQGARSKADTSRMALKWMMVGVEKTGPATAIMGDGFSAIRVMTTNCRPISAPAAPPTIT
jgi:hypothetical protein